MSERLKPFPTRYSPDISPEWEKMARTAIEAFIRVATQGVETEGKENIPKDIESAPYIVAVNHLGWAEAIVLLNVFPTWIHWMSKSGNFDHKLLGPIFRLSGAFPVRRGEVDRRALQTAIELLEKKRILGMAPEGTRGRGEKLGKLKKAKHGTTYIASLAHIPIITTAVWGPEKLLPLIEEKGLKLEDLSEFKRPKIFVRIGQLFKQHLEVEFEKLDKVKLEKLTTNLMLEIRGMLPPEYHGYYAGIERQPL